MTLSEALAEAKNLEARAVSAEKKGNRASELTLATQAWQLMRQFPESAEARQHQFRLEKRIESAAQAANAATSTDSEDRSIMLIER